MKDYLRIITAGSIAIALQRYADIKAISVEGFVSFILIFMLVSFLFQFIVNRKKTEKTEKQKKSYLPLLKKVAIVVLTSVVLNTTVNFVLYHSGRLDRALQYKDVANNQAIVLNLKDRTPVEKFELMGFYYFLYRQNGKYYLVVQNSKVKQDKLVTRYDSVYLSWLFDALKDEPRADFNDIIKNLSPVVYIQLSRQEMLFESLWFVNSDHYKKAFWRTDEVVEIKKRYDDYLAEKRYQALEQKNTEYEALLNKEVEKLSLAELLQLKTDLYSYYAYTRDTRYVFAIFDEIEKRGNKKKDEYWMALTLYMFLLMEKEKLNDILRKNYGMEVNSSFPFDDGYFLGPNEYSYVKLLNSDNKQPLYLWPDKINEIKSVNGTVLIDFKHEENITLTDFVREDADKIVTLLKNMLKSVAGVEKLYYRQMCDNQE